jgi:hypothetical protein
MGSGTSQLHKQIKVSLDGVTNLDAAKECDEKTVLPVDTV